MIVSVAYVPWWTSRSHRHLPAPRILSLSLLFPYSSVRALYLNDGTLLLIAYPDFENNGSAAEEMLPNPETSVGTGYSESKWVAERILDAAAERTALQPVVVRFGQVCGDGNGTWNETEWFPSLVKSALTLGCLPSLDGVSGWY